MTTQRVVTVSERQAELWDATVASSGEKERRNCVICITRHVTDVTGHITRPNNLL